MTATTANLRDHLQEQGYDPQDAYTPLDPYAPIGDAYDLTVSGVGTVRVCVYPDDCYRADVYVFDQYMTLVWDGRLSPGAPDAAILAVIEAAEWELAAKRGGPVTPAQAEAARLPTRLAFASTTPSPPTSRPTPRPTAESASPTPSASYSSRD